jgi:hypothetical protein
MLNCTRVKAKKSKHAYINAPPSKFQYKDKIAKYAMFTKYISSHIWPYGNEVYIKLVGLC